jgi:hypothetical protein
MEPKDKTYLKKQLKDEYEAISKTAFWRDYALRLEDERRAASRHCETDENIAKWQGFIRCIDTVSGLPAEVIGVTPRKF